MLLRSALVRQLLPIAAALLAAPLAAHPLESLPGVENVETTIPAGGIAQYHRGHGDVIFVRDRINRWYRVQVNDGCLRQMREADALVFDQSFPATRIDRFTRVRQPALGASCFIESIRRSAAPPQVDSQSLVTLD